MAITTGELSKALERVRHARTTLKYAVLVKDHCHQVADHVLALADYERLYPKGWSSSTYLELQLELDLLDSTFEMLEKQLKNAERSLAEATGTMTEAVALEKLGVVAPTRGGASIDEVFDAEIANVQVMAENVSTLNEVYMDRVKTVRDMLGI